MVTNQNFSFVNGVLLLQWSHGRLTVVTPGTEEDEMDGYGLQWSHGRLTVVTGQYRNGELIRGHGFNGATVV